MVCVARIPVSVVHRAAQLADPVDEELEAVELPDEELLELLLEELESEEDEPVVLDEESDELELEPAALLLPLVRLSVA